MNNYLVEAIRKLKPKSQFTFTDDDYSSIQWIVLEGEAPTQAEIDVAIEEVKEEELQTLTDKESAKAALLERLGITAEEAKLLIG
jgi:hypothetical protein